MLAFRSRVVPQSELFSLNGLFIFSLNVTG